MDRDSLGEHLLKPMLCRGLGPLRDSLGFRVFDIRSLRRSLVWVLRFRVSG